MKTRDLEVNSQGGGKGSETEHLYEERQETEPVRSKKARKPVPATVATEDGVQPADNADYDDGHNIGP